MSLEKKERKHWKRYVESVTVEYLNPKWMRMEGGEGSTTRNFIVFTVYPIKSRRLIKNNCSNFLSSFVLSVL